MEASALYIDSDSIMLLVDIFLSTSYALLCKIGVVSILILRMKKKGLQWLIDPKLGNTSDV